MANSFRSNIFGGYNREDVNSFVERIGKEFEKVKKESSELRELLESMRNKLDYYKQMEGTLNNAILLAQKAAEQVHENSAKECELMRREAEAAARQELAQAEAKVRELNAEFMRLQQEAVAFRANFKAVLTAQLDVLGRFFSE